MNLISDLGGQLGLWLGLSAITIGELCSLIFIISRSVTSIWFSSSETSPCEMSTQTSNMTTLEEIYEDLCPEAAQYKPPDVGQFRKKTSKI
ncbi:degenerin deg-1 [Elysia marginata]|uniref:Degenerin deg-1 n=1 Tax=Elysia marginata TaxID=1093978 RepID=A0AAV4FZF9_9GAST|nr:degenerin deg-1 [Elysia marginata]